MDCHFLIVGAGLYGLVIAERIAAVLRAPVLVIDKNEYLGGNCHATYDAETGIECHAHGSHIFHTKNVKVWNYIRDFTEFNTYQHKVLSRCRGRVFQMPVNLKTVNDFYGVDFSPSEAVEFLKKEIGQYVVEKPRNLEEKAISLIGKPLYDALIREYTLKQWGQDPLTLPEGIISRLPVRTNYNSNYYDDIFQGIPLNGYNKMFANLVSDPLIKIQLNTQYSDLVDSIPKDVLVIYTGMVDELMGYRYGELGWRSLRFMWETLDMPDYQGTAVMNYADESVPYTRIHEFKHYHAEDEMQSKSKTIICREYPHKYSRGDAAYYPLETAENRLLYERYKSEVEKDGRVILGGRLGC